MLALSLIMFSYLFDGKVDLSCVGSWLRHSGHMPEAFLLPLEGPDRGENNCQP